jgi:hypothetical protein|tara:strand:- start:847 stop:1308 length:462 start_codon:yes stop_codon:yes gene_type:complete
MRTPSLETREDQKREERIAGYLEGAWHVTCHKLPTSYALDYWIESKEKCYWCEVKVRTFSIEKYDTLILSMAKLRKGASYARSTNIPFIIVYAMTDGLYYHEWDPNHLYDIRMNLSQDPKYDEDNEPYVHIPVNMLKCISDKPLGLDRNEIGF